MPRMSEAEKHKSHKRILDAAARLLRERGVEATSVSDVMQMAGLTHGGFYRHFDNKEDLVAAAFQEAVDDVVTEIETSLPGPDRAAARDAYISRYLSAVHVKNRGDGCPLAALAADLVRIDGAPRKVGAKSLNRMAHLLGSADTPSQGIALMALLVGSVTLARLAETEEQINDILDSGRTAAQILQQSYSSSAE